MKITLHKPQREAANAVLAYDYEPPDSQDVYDCAGCGGPTWYSSWHDDAVCRDDDCYQEEGGGSCTVYFHDDQWCNNDAL